MKLIIDIPEEEYKCVQITGHIGNVTAVSNAIYNGIPLPKGHSRLIDADEIVNELNALKDNWNPYKNEYESGRYESYDYAVDTINDAPTILEADKEDEDETSN